MVKNMDEKVLGIYLGTDCSAACVCINDKPTIIPSAEGTSLYGKAFPSYVAFTENGTQLVGQPAKDQAIENPENTISGISRYLGTNYKFSIRGKEYTPQEISAIILRKIKRDAETFLGEPVTKAVITVPAYFDDNQRMAIKDAGTIAGLQVLQLINEPIAACFAYNIHNRREDNINILIFDWGKGTLDITIIEFNNGVFEVQSTSGDTSLGGTDMDNVLIRYLADEFEKKHGIDLTQDYQSMNRLRGEVKKARIDLSITEETEVKIPFIAMDNYGNPLNLIQKITRSKFKYLIYPIVEKCGESINQAIHDADLTIGEIDKVILLCETKDIPIFQDYLERYIGTSIEKGIASAECKAIGASMRSRSMGDVIFDNFNVMPVSLGLVVGNCAKIMIEKNTRLPTEHTEIFTTVRDNQTELSFELVKIGNTNANLNKTLGSFVLEVIQPAPRGTPQIEVTFRIDENGILNVIAKDLVSGRVSSNSNNLNLGCNS